MVFASSFLSFFFKLHFLFYRPKTARKNHRFPHGKAVF